MQVGRLRLANFRNYRSLELEANPRINLFLGKNGQGKSNLLEAVYYLLNGTSYRTKRDEQLVRWGEECFFLSGEVRENGSCQIEISFSLSRQKKAAVNGKRVSSLQKMRASFPAVIFTPEGLQTVKGAPALRREYLDRILGVLFPEYDSLLAEYQRGLAQRNRLLRSGKSEGIEEWEDILSAAGARIVAYRFRILPLLAAEIKKSYLNIEKEKGVEVSYSSSVALDGEPFFSSSAAVEYYLQQVSGRVKNCLQSALAKNRKKDRERGFTTAGPHRDDLVFRIAGKDVRNYASQGEQRSMALALRLGEAAVLEKKLGKKPVILLDDVFSELDAERRQILVESLDLMSRQVFVTTTEISAVPRAEEILERSSLWEIREGQAYSREVFFKKRGR